MRIYNNFAEMFSEVQRDVVELGHKVSSESVQNIRAPGEDYDMMEIIGYSYELTCTDDFVKCFTDREKLWLGDEFLERIKRESINPGEAWKRRAEVWGPFIGPDGKFDYTYNERMKPQLHIISHELRHRPNTRQAVMTIFSPLYFKDAYFFGGFRRIPCSLSYQFLIRNAKLNLIYVMRSCDVATHFKFDAALACMLVNYMAIEVDRDPGSLIHHIGSLHMFRKDAKGVF